MPEKVKESERLYREDTTVATAMRVVSFSLRETYGASIGSDLTELI